MSIFKQISNLAHHSAIYAISTAMQKMPAILLMPIYTRMDYIPSRSDYGEYVTIFTFIAFMNFFYNYGMDSAMMRYFFLGERDRKTVFSSTFYILLVTSLITTAAVIFFSPFLADTLLDNPAGTDLFRITGLILIFDALGNLPYLILRAEEKSVQFTMFRGLRFSLELIFNVIFVVVLKLGVAGILYTSLAASLINFLVMTPIIFRYLTAKIDFSLVKELFIFGLPFLPNGIAFTVIEMIDRFLVPNFLGKDALGVYGANYKFGAILMLVISAFRNAWQPFFLKIAHQENAREIYSRVLTYFLAGAAMIILGVTFFIRDALTFDFFGKGSLLGPMYWDGIGIIPIILLSYSFYGIYVILTPGFYIEKQSKYMIVFTGSGALVNIAANFYLLPTLNSYWGAAWATLISYFVMALTIYLVSNRIYPIEVEWGRIGIIAGLLAVCMGIFYIFHPVVLLRIVLLLVALLVLWRWVLNDTERSGILQKLQRFRKD